MCNEDRSRHAECFAREIAGAVENSTREAKTREEPREDSIEEQFDRFQSDISDPSVIVFSEIKRCQLPYFTQFFQKAKMGSSTGGRSELCCRSAAFPTAQPHSKAYPRDARLSWRRHLTAARTSAGLAAYERSSARDDDRVRHDRVPRHPGLRYAD